MATLSRSEIEAALRRLGELAYRENEEIKLVVVGGAAMLLVYNARATTRDVDVLITAPNKLSVVRGWIKQVAR